MYYFGLLKNTLTVEVFYSTIKPDYNTHSNLYGLVFGGYKTRALANLNASYQYVYAKIVNIDMRTKESQTHRNLFAIAGIG